MISNHRATIEPTAPPIGIRSDWVIVALPTALSLRWVNATASVAIIGLLVLAAFIRKPENRFSVHPGPLLCMIAACTIVFSRPDIYYSVVAFTLVIALIFRLVMIIDARKAIVSLIDGLGLFLILNILSAIIDIRGNLLTSRTEAATGFVRTVFPLGGSINSPAIIAGAYLITSLCFLHNSSWLRRSFWLACSAAAVYTTISAGSRTALAITAVLAPIALFLPSVSRWIAQAATAFSAISAFALPNITNLTFSTVTPLIALAPGRETTEANVISLQGRQYIWDGAINYWTTHITGISDTLLGFGENGQYQSGASLTYIWVVRGIGGRPEFASVHNSFLQQLFDGGVLGWLLLLAASFWASVRLASNRRKWAPWGASAIFAMTVVMLTNATEATMAPGVYETSFWLLLLLVGISCQGDQVDAKDGVASGATLTIPTIGNA